jgi:alkylation response protein AidB-like acyl-CoA dehydrogenase
MLRRHRAAGYAAAVRRRARRRAAAAALIEQTAETLDGNEYGDKKIAAAGSYVRTAATRIAGDAMQIHGANGYTWDHPCHRLLKRAEFDERYLTTLWSQRDALARLVLDAPVPPAVG